MRRRETLEAVVEEGVGGDGGGLEFGGGCPRIVLQSLALGGGRRATEGQFEGVSDTGFPEGRGVAGNFLDDPRGQTLGKLDESGVVGDGEGLQGCVGTRTPGAGRLEVRGVEGAEEGVGCAPVEKGVHGPAIALFAGACAPTFSVLGEGVDALRLRGEDPMSANLRVVFCRILRLIPYRDGQTQSSG